MRSTVFSLVAAAALLASVGAAVAGGPVKLTDVQLDKATAGAATDDTSFLLALSTAELGRLVALSDWSLGFLNGIPQPLQTPLLSAPTATP